MKILVCGLPGSGKTWLAERLQKNIKNCAWYNADFVRKYSNDWDFEVEGRIRQANRMKAFADFEKSQRFQKCPKLPNMSQKHKLSAQWRL